MRLWQHWFVLSFLICPLIAPFLTVILGEDEADAGEFMVQCETCKVWQHGLCMGYDSEEQVHDADYFGEQGRPELHGELLKYVQLCVWPLSVFLL